jgi:excisionase family DNA binding protein
MPTSPDWNTVVSAFVDEMASAIARKVADELDARHLNAVQKEPPSHKADTMKISAPPPRTNGALLTTSEAAEILGIHTSTLSNWRSTKRYNIPYKKVGGSVRYRLDDIEKWLSSRSK